MKALVYFAAPNPNGSSMQIVKRMQEKLSSKIEIRNISSDTIDVTEINNFKTILIITATYGDQELQDNMENFLTSIKSDLSSQLYIICEIGNYYGYDDYTFGSGKIIGDYISGLGAKQLLEMTSIDSLPKLDLVAVDNWINKLEKALS